MVYKKYIKKDGKLYGPYLYHSVKKDGKVTTNYIGRPDESNEIKIKGKSFVKSNKFLIIFLSIVAFALLLNLTLNINLFPTGKVSSDIQSVYMEGQNLKGQVNLILKQGELFPSDSQVVIDNGGNAEEYLLSSLIHNEKVTGNFYVEGKEINGSGEGYGIPGEKEVFPNVLFSFKLVPSFEAGNISVEENVSGSAGGAGGAGGEFDVGVVVNETQTGPINNESVPSNETTPVNETPIQEPEQPSDGEVTPETPVQEPPVQETTTPPVSETTPPSTETTVSSETIAPSEEPPAETPSESTSTNEGVSITGEAIGEDIIEGVVSKNSPYEYLLNEGETIEIIDSSQSVSFEIIDGKAVFKTEYSEIQQGYGQEFTGDEKLIIPISLNNLSIKAKEGTLKISFVYNEEELTSSTKKISVKPLPIINQTNETLILNITNVTAQNITNFTKIEKINKLLEKKIKLERKALDALRVDDKVRVIIKTKPGAVSVGEKLEGLEDYEVVELDEFNIELLDENEVDEIIIDQPVSALISDSEQLIRSVNVRTEFGLSGLGKKICIIDTGVDGSVTPFTLGYDFVNNDNDASDDNGHGTQVAYIAKSVASGAELLVAKVLDAYGQGYESQVLEGLQWCVDNGANIISFSIGSGDYNGFCDSNVVAELANGAVTNGVFVAAATGNDGTTNMKSPACASQVARVSSTDKQDNIASFSNVNEALDVFAPGKDISTQTLGGSVTSISGTSASVPFVSGAAALVLENETLAPLDLRYRFASTGKPILHSLGGNLTINISRLDVYNAILNIKTMEPYNVTLSQANETNVTNFTTLAAMTITLTNPIDNYYDSNSPANINFMCDISDGDGVKWVQLFTDISGTWQQTGSTINVANMPYNSANRYSTTWNGGNSYTTTFKPNSVYGVDTYIVSSFWTGNNYGSNNEMAAGISSPIMRSLIKFDDLSVIPSGATITSANLRLLATPTSNSVSVDAYRVTNIWVEGNGVSGSGASWNTRDGANLWVTIGGDFNSDIRASASVVPSTWAEFNLLSLVNEWRSGVSNNYGIILKGPEIATSRAIFYTSDSSTSSNWPELVVTYTIPTTYSATFPVSGISSGPYRWTCRASDFQDVSAYGSDRYFRIGPCSSGSDCFAGNICVNGICRVSCEGYSGYACSAGAGLISTGTCQDDFLGVSSCVTSGFLSMDCRNDNPNYFGAGADLTDNCVLGGDISYTAHDFQSYDSCDSAVGGNFVQDGLVGVVTSSAVCVTADCVWDAGGVVASCAYSGSTLEVNEGKDCAISPHTSGDFTPEGKLDPNTSPAHCATCAGYLDDAAYGSTCERACSMTMNNLCDEQLPETCPASNTYCSSTCGYIDRDTDMVACQENIGCRQTYWDQPAQSGAGECCGDDGTINTEDWDADNYVGASQACYNGALRSNGPVAGTRALAYGGYLYDCGNGLTDDPNNVAATVNDCSEAGVAGVTNWFCDLDASSGDYWIQGGKENSCSCTKGEECFSNLCIKTGAGGTCEANCNDYTSDGATGYLCADSSIIETGATYNQYGICTVKQGGTSYCDMSFAARQVSTLGTVYDDCTVSGVDFGWTCDSTSLAGGYWGSSDGRGVCGSTSHATCCSDFGRANPGTPTVIDTCGTEFSLCSNDNYYCDDVFDGTWDVGSTAGVDKFRCQSGIRNCISCDANNIEMADATLTPKGTSRMNGDGLCESICGASSQCDEGSSDSCTGLPVGYKCTSSCIYVDRDSAQTACTTGAGCTVYSWISGNLGGNYPCCGDDGNNDDWDKDQTGASGNACFNGALTSDGIVSGALLSYNGYLYDCGNQFDSSVGSGDSGVGAIVDDCGQAGTYYCDADASTIPGTYWINNLKPNDCGVCTTGSQCNSGMCIDSDGFGAGTTGTCRSACDSLYSGYECSDDVYDLHSTGGLSTGGGVCVKDYGASYPSFTWICDKTDASYIPFPIIPTSTHFESCYDPFQPAGGTTSVVACDSDVSDSLGTLGYIANGKCAFGSGSLFSQGNYECDAGDVCFDGTYYRQSCGNCYISGTTVRTCDSNGGSTYGINGICSVSNTGFGSCQTDDVCYDSAESRYQDRCNYCSTSSTEVDNCDLSVADGAYTAQGYCTATGGFGTCSIGTVYESAGLLYDGPCTNGLGNRCDFDADGTEDGSWNNYADGVCVVGSTCDVDNVCKKVADYYGVMSSCTDGDNCDYDVGNNGFEPDGKVCSSQCVVDGSVAPLGACCQNANCNQVGGFPFCANGGTINGAPYGKACCDAATDCYANGVCYNAGEVYAGSPYSYYCEAGTWDAIPYVDLNSPSASPPSVTERIPTFTWTGHDEEASPLVYRFKLIRKNLCPIESDIIDWDTASSAFYTPSNPLSCFYNTAPDDFYYEWSAEASDDNGVRWGPWATPRRLEIREVVSIILNRNPVDFGTLAYNGIDDTADNSPLPFVLENDGNVIVDVDLYAGIPGTPDPLWNTQPSTSAYFKYKADNYIGPPDESGSFNVLSSITSWTNTPIGELNKQIFLVDFNWDNTKDSSEIDLFVQVPGTPEGAGARSSTITFTATSKE